MNNASFARNMLRFLRAWLLRVLAAMWRSNATRVFIVIWFLIVVAAPLREIACTTFASGHEFFSIFGDEELEDDSKIPISSLPLHDAVARLEDSQHLDLSADRYRVLIKKHPKNAMLIARFLTFALATKLINRVPFHVMTGAQSPSSSPPSFPLGINAPIMSGAFSSSDVREIKRLRELISFAQRGQKLDPQNAFFDAVIIRCCVELKRDEIAFQILAESRFKKFYDSYEMDGMRALGDAARQRYPYTIEYRSSLGDDEYWSPRFDIGEVILLSEMWHRKKQKYTQKSSDLRAFQLQSLKRRADFAQLYAKILFSRSRSVQQNAHTTLLFIWRNNWSQKSPPLFNFSLKDNRIWSRSFADEALELEQPMIAKETMKIAAAFEKLHQCLITSEADDDFSFSKLHILSSFEAMALGQIILSIALFVFLSVFLNRAEKTLRLNKVAVNSALAGAGCGAVFLLFCYFLFYTGRYQDHDKINNLLTMVGVTGFLLAPLSVIWLWHIFIKVEHVNKELKTLSGHLIEYSMSPPLKKLLDFAAFSAVVQLWIFAAIHLVCDALSISSFKIPFLNSETFYSSNGDGWVSFGLGILVLLLYCVMVWRWPTQASHRAFSYARLRSFRSACSISIATGSVIFLLCILMSVPTRRDAAQKFDAYLKHDGLWLATGQNSAQWIAKLK